MERVEGKLHEVHGPRGVLEARVLRARIDERRHAELPYPPKALDPWVREESQQEVVVDGYETVYGVINYLLFHRLLTAKLIALGPHPVGQYKHMSLGNAM